MSNQTAGQRLKNAYAGLGLKDKETVLDERPANIRRGMEYAGGKMVLTNRRLLLRPHGLNANSRPVDIDLADIASVEPFNQFWVIPSGMRVVLKDGDEHRLVVGGRDATIELIRSAVRL
jgi:hypothetical protein